MGCEEDSRVPPSRSPIFPSQPRDASRLWLVVEAGSFLSSTLFIAKRGERVSGYSLQCFALEAKLDKLLHWELLSRLYKARTIIRAISYRASGTFRRLRSAEVCSVTAPGPVASPGFLSVFLF